MEIHRKLIVAVPVCFVIVFLAYVAIPRETVFEKCGQIVAPMLRTQCLIPYFKKLTADTSPTEAIAVAKNLQKEGVIDDCHIIAHVIGAESLRNNDSNPGKAFATCGMECVEGCYHGVMEEYVVQKGTNAPDADELTDICNGVLPDTTLKRQCLHGIGHGLLRHSSGSLKEAIDMCENFLDDYSATMCLGGVFMQNVHNILTMDEKVFLEKITTVCTPNDVVLDSRSESICVEAIGPGIMFYTGHDLEKTKGWCLLLDEKNQNMCIFSAEEELKLHNSQVEG